MSAKKIRRGTLKQGETAVGDVKNFNWSDSAEFDRTAVDDEMSGTPVKMKDSGSGSFETTSDSLATGYSDDLEFIFSEIAVGEGGETVTKKKAVFNKVTINAGGNVDNDSGPGSRRYSFDYGSCVVSAVGA